MKLDNIFVAILLAGREQKDIKTRLDPSLSVSNFTINKFINPDMKLNHKQTKKP